LCSTPAIPTGRALCSPCRFEQQTWEEFLTYRLLKGRFNWYEFDEADDLSLYTFFEQLLTDGRALSNFPDRFVMIAVKLRYNCGRGS